MYQNKTVYQHWVRLFNLYGTEIRVHPFVYYFITVLKQFNNKLLQPVLQMNCFMLLSV